MTFRHNIADIVNTLVASLDILNININISNININD